MNIKLNQRSFFNKGDSMKLFIFASLISASFSTTIALASEDYQGKYVCPMSAKAFLLINFSDHGTKLGSEVGRDITLINGAMGNENFGPFSVSNPNTEKGFDWVFTDETEQEVARVIVDQKTSATVVRVTKKLDIHIPASTYPCYMIEKDMITQVY